MLWNCYYGLIDISCTLTLFLQDDSNCLNETNNIFIIIYTSWVYNSIMVAISSGLVENVNENIILIKHGITESIIVLGKRIKSDIWTVCY